jgi:hypothetical protein
MRFSPRSLSRQRVLHGLYQLVLESTLRRAENSSVINAAGKLESVIHLAEWY